MISTNENAKYLPFEGKTPTGEEWFDFKSMPKNSLYYIFATNGCGFNEEQQSVIMKIKEELIGETTPNRSPIWLSEKNLFEIIDVFQYSITSTQINALITKNIDITKID